jgi:hypothetical protein
MASNRKYPSTQLSTDARELIARVAGPLAERGVNLANFRAALEEAGYDVSKRSMHRWVHDLAETSRVFAVEKASGATPLLDSCQCEIAAGFVLVQNDEHKPVSVESFQRFCKLELGVALSHGSAVNYLHNAGFSSKVARSKTTGFHIDIQTLSAMAFEWCEDRQQAGDLRGLMASVDFTFTGHHTDRRVSFAPTGGAQPKSHISIAQHTNCIITVVWSDGQNRTPPVLFTFNGKFRRDRVGREAWIEEKRWLDECLRDFGIEPWRVVYIGKEKNETRLYASESAELLQRFFELYELPDDVVVFTDNGKAFFPCGASALEPLGFTKHVPYPAPVHQYLSPNDNRLHGTAKRSWRESGIDFKDDVQSSLLLLNHLDIDISKQGAKWFQRNITALTKETALELISGRGGKGADIDHDRRYAYRFFAGLDG